MQNLIERRKRRSISTRAKISELHYIRLTVHRTNAHIYAQIIDATGSKVLSSASTLEPELKKQNIYGGNIAAAALIGRRIAEKAKKIGIETIAFDRSGYKYHGRIKALAEAAREHGLKF